MLFRNVFAPPYLVVGMDHLLSRCKIGLQTVPVTVVDVVDVVSDALVERPGAAPDAACVALRSGQSLPQGGGMGRMRGAK